MSPEHWSNDILMPPPPWGIAGRQAGNINRIYHSNDKMQRSQVATQREGGKMGGRGQGSGLLAQWAQNGFRLPAAWLTVPHYYARIVRGRQQELSSGQKGRGRERRERRRGIGIGICAHEACSDSQFQLQRTRMLHMPPGTQFMQQQLQQSRRCCGKAQGREGRQGKASRQTDRGTDKETESETGKQTVIQRESNRCRERATRN